jgi:hypothetical protein
VAKDYSIACNDIKLLKLESVNLRFSNWNSQIFVIYSGDNNENGNASLTL